MLMFLTKDKFVEPHIVVRRSEKVNYIRSNYWKIQC